MTDNLKRAFNHFTLIAGYIDYDELTQDLHYKLGYYIYKNSDNRLRAEALIECDAFELHSKCIFDGPHELFIYSKSVFEWCARCFESEYQDFINVKKKNRG